MFEAPLLVAASTPLSIQIRGKLICKTGLCALVSALLFPGTVKTIPSYVSKNAVLLFDIFNTRQPKTSTDVSDSQEPDWTESAKAGLL